MLPSASMGGLTLPTTSASTPPCSIPTHGLAYGNVVNRDWAVALAQAYNNWLYDTYLKRDSRFRAVGLIPMQEPGEAIKELRRCVEELGMAGAMLPSNGFKDHIGAKGLLAGL